IPDDVMQLSIRTRLGLETHPGSAGLQCVCSKENAFQLDAHHAFTCASTRGKATIQRHDLILYRMAVWTRRAGIPTSIEPNHLSKDKRLRPDIILNMTSGMRIVDVTAVHPLTAARVGN